MVNVCCILFCASCSWLTNRCCLSVVLALLAEKERAKNSRGLLFGHCVLPVVFFTRESLLPSGVVLTHAR